MTCAWTVTSRAVVGSSATISFGSRDSAIAISTPLPLPAGQLVRVGGERAARVQADQVQQLGRRPRPPRRVTCLSWALMVMAGFSEESASW